MTDYARFRRTMVENQLRPNRVSDSRLLAAMGEIPRELFVPKPLRGVAYVDDDLRLPGGRFLIEPMVLGRLLQAARIDADDVVLVLGGGTGYCAAVAARLAATVFLLDDDPEQARQIEARMDELGVDNVVIVVTERPDAGHPSQAPFDVILLAGLAFEIPPALLEQLGDGGRLAAIEDGGRVGKATLHTRVEGTIGRRVQFDAGTPPLPFLRRREAFVF